MTVFSFAHQRWWICGDVRRDGNGAFIADSEMCPGLVGVGPLMIEATAAFRQGVARWIEDNPDLRKNLVQRVQPTSPKGEVGP